jgi:hypothetical protein
MGPHLAFLRGLPLVFRSGAAVFAHAGFDPRRGSAFRDEAAVLAPPAPPTALPDDLLLIHGHFAAETPVDTPNRICVDTGAYFSGRLTAVRLDQGRAFLSAAETRAAGTHGSVMPAPSAVPLRTARQLFDFACLSKNTIELTITLSS